MKQLNSPRRRCKGIGLALALTLGALLAFGAVEAAGSLGDLAAAVHLDA